METFSFFLLEKEAIPWEKIDACYDSHIYKMHGWVNHLCQRLNLEPFIVEIFRKKISIGYFIGERTTKFLIKIVGSPFKGWETPFQGCCFYNEISSKERVQVYANLIHWCLANKYCDFIQIADWHLPLEYVVHSNLSFKLTQGYFIDLTRTSDEILGSMNKSTRGQIKKIFKDGFDAFKIEKVTDFRDFVNHHYEQLVDVFAKQGLTPTHSKEFVMHSIMDMAGNNQIVAYEVLVDGKSVASCYRYFAKGMGFAVAAASFREYQHLYLNESLYYVALLDLKEKGVEIFECGGGRNYKEKYGPIPYVRPVLVESRFKCLVVIESMLEKLYPKITRIRYLIKRGVKKENKIR